MRILWWITKSTNTNSKYVTHFFSTATMVARTRLMLRYVYIASVVIFASIIKETSPQNLHASSFCNCSICVVFIFVHFCSVYLDRWIQTTANFVLHMELREYFHKCLKKYLFALHWKFRNQFVLCSHKFHIQQTAVFTLFYISGVLFNIIILLTNCHTVI